MKNRDIVVRLRPYIRTRTWAQIKNMTMQKVINAFIAYNDPLSEHELTQLKRWGLPAVKYLKGEWMREQHTGFVVGKISEKLNLARTECIDYMVLQGLSPATAEDIFDTKGVPAFVEGLNNG